MRRWVAITVLAWALGSMTAAADKRVALVIGNSAYNHAPALKNPRHDAEDLAVALRRLGFEVLVGLDLDARGMTQTARDFSRALEGADVGLFFYAGHGLQSKGVNHLVPIDAALKAESDLDFETLSVDLVLRQMQRSARVSLVMLDACRDNPLTRGLRSGGRSATTGQGLARIDDAAGMLIAFSTQPGNVALDGQGRNSPFTRALLVHLEHEGASISDIMIDVRKQVMAETSDRQVPWENSSLTGKFYFKPGPATGAIAAARPAEPAPARKEVMTVADATVDHTYWTSIAGSNDAGLYREYLVRFPNGTYAAIAQSKIASLAAPAVPDKGQQVAMAAPAPAPAEASRGVATQASPRQLAEGMQRELKRVGCYGGQVDGDWGPGSQRALARFNAQSGEALSMTPSAQALARLTATNANVCRAAVAEPRPVPRRVQQSSSANDAAAAAIVGGVVGGVIGAQIGRRR